MQDLPKVASSRIFEFDGELYEMILMDYETNVAEMRHLETKEVISVVVDGVTIKIEGVKL